MRFYVFVKIHLEEQGKFAWDFIKPVEEVYLFVTKA